MLYCILYCITVALYCIILQKFQCSKSAITIKILFVDFARPREGWAKVSITNHLLKPNGYFTELKKSNFSSFKVVELLSKPSQDQGSKNPFCDVLM